MNGLSITGIKLSSPAPAKKTTSIPIAKSNKTSSKLPSYKPAPAVQAKKIQPKLKEEKKAEIIAKDEKKSQVPQIQIQQKLSKQAAEQIPSVLEQAALKQEMTLKEEEPEHRFDVMLRYNHYKDCFPCVNGVLQFQTPNEKYCFGLVFKGNYQPLIRHFGTREIIPPLTVGRASEFSWKVVQGEIYEVQIQQDEQQEAKYEKHVYRAPEQPKKCSLRKNQRVEQLTQELKRMGVDEFGSDKHRELLEQRDLEDILYG